MPESDVVEKGCIHCYADRRKMTFCFGENRQFQVGVDIRQLEHSYSVENIDGIIITYFGVLCHPEKTVGNPINNSTVNGDSSTLLGAVHIRKDMI